MRRCACCAGENPDEARFCMYCGAPLPSACGRCGAELPDGARFCPQCATPVRVAAREVPSVVSEARAYTPKQLFVGSHVARRSVET